MSVTPIANRIMNGCILCMLLACLVLWAANTNLPKKHPSPSQTTSAPKITKKTKTMVDSDAAKIVTENEEAQMRQDAMMKMDREASDPRLREALRDPVYRESLIFAGTFRNESLYSDIWAL